MNITETQLLHQYEKYTVEAGNHKKNRQQPDNKNTVMTGRDTVDISKEGHNALRNKMSAPGIIESREDVKKLSPISSFSIMGDFERTVSEKKPEKIQSNAFDCHVNQMVSAYHQMKSHIEDKYSDTDREPQYYIADDGSMQLLTKERELEMLDQAYTTYSKFMASSTEVWSNLQIFKPQITYQSKNSGTEASMTINNTKKGEISQQTYQAFMSAVNDANIKLLSQGKEGLDKIKLSLNISISARSELNRIWDWQALSK